MGSPDYLKATNELNPNLNVTVLVNNGTVMTRKFDQATGIAAPELKIDEAGLQPGLNHRPDRGYRHWPDVLFRPR